MDVATRTSAGQRLAGKRAFVSGGTRGLGRAVVLALVQEGAAVAICARTVEPLNSLVDEIREGGGQAIAVPADCGLPDEAQRAVESAHAQLHGLEILVNAAGIHPAWERVGEQPTESWESTIRTNLSGYFYTCRAALPLLAAGGGGAVVNISSVSAGRGWQLYSPYNVSKAGIESLTRTIAVEYAKDGVRANCVIPGVIDTGITSDILERDPSLREGLIAMHPLGRMGTAEEVAEAVVWLASDASSFTTGIALPVDGGFLA
jgi:NAD(P)-dependent dehydrogenase (short-subunit alcohol dehydrogenase family)